ncbi:MAG: T9SS type A sorting domain-containing protein [Chitinophagales bacterium]
MKPLFPKHLFIIGVIYFSIIPVYSQHIVAGEISYRNDSPLSYSISIYTISKDDPVDFILIDFGDGTGDTVYLKESNPLVNQIMEIYLENCYKNEYEITHTFAGPGNFNIVGDCGYMEEGLTNVLNSGEKRFLLESELVIGDPLLIGTNNSPISYSTLDYYYPSGTSYYVSQNIYDIEHDKIEFFFDEEFQIPQATEYIYIEQQTGDFWWKSPLAYGRYYFNIKIRESRGGINLGYTTTTFTINHFEETNISIYPIPAGDQLYIDFLGNHFEEYSIKIYNTLGQIVYELNDQSNNPELGQIDISYLIKSIYFLEFKSGNTVRTLKFLKAS